MPVDDPIVIYTLTRDTSRRDLNAEWRSFRTPAQQEDEWDQWMLERNEPADLGNPEQGMDQI